MKHLLILSGKGGTGKTTIAGAFIRLSEAMAYADCDVDAPNLDLIIKHSADPKKTVYYGLPKAKIDPILCVQCDRCLQGCRFKAILKNTAYRIDPYACEGCGICEAVCPVGAVSLRPAAAGELILYTDKGSVFSTAQLKMGSGNSGMLVTEVKKQMNASVDGIDLAIIDGSPGIGCPVIASLRGADMVLIVSEPSVSGISDMERIIKSAEIFKIKISVCVNKYDTNTVNAARIENFCKIKGLPFAGKIPFDQDAVKAVNEGRTIVDMDCISGRAVKDVFINTIKLLNEETAGAANDH